MGKTKMFVLGLLALVLMASSAYAGTGGTEVADWYNDISSALEGFWGKIIAVAFIGIAIILFKGGSIIGGIFMFALGLSIGTIPSIVDSKYTALAGESRYDSHAYLIAISLVAFAVVAYTTSKHNLLKKITKEA